MHPLATYERDGRSYVLGVTGERYAVIVSNPTPRRVEAVLSIDGLDAIDGKPADYVHKRGYILPAYGSATIEGFRTSLEQVATFRFSSVADSYAGRLGQARDVGVIGVAFFPERETVVAVAPPMDRGHDVAPRAAGAAPRALPRAEADRSREAAPSATQGLAGGDLSAQERKGLGTEFGESRESRVEETEFQRASASTPGQVSVVRYNDRAGLMALGIRVDPPALDAELRTRETADPFRASRFAQPPP
jgi:hypothetical protein